RVFPSFPTRRSSDLFQFLLPLNVYTLSLTLPALKRSIISPLFVCRLIFLVLSPYEQPLILQTAMFLEASQNLLVFHQRVSRFVRSEEHTSELQSREN